MNWINHKKHQPHEQKISLTETQRHKAKPVLDKIYRMYRIRLHPVDPVDPV